MDDADDIAGSSPKNRKGKTVLERVRDLGELDGFLTEAGIDVNTLSSDRVLSEISVGCLLVIYRKLNSNQVHTWRTINRLFGKVFEDDVPRLQRFRRLLSKKMPKKGDAKHSLMNEKLSVVDLALNDSELNVPPIPTCEDQGNGIKREEKAAEMQSQSVARVVQATSCSDMSFGNLKALTACRSLKRRLRRCKKRIACLTSDKRKLSSKLRGDQRRASQIKRLKFLNGSVSNDLGSLQQQLAAKSAMIQGLNQRIHELEALILEGQNEQTTIETFHGNKFTDKMVECVLNLQMCSVADEQIPRVIRYVAELAGVRFRRVPAPSTCRDLSLAGLQLARGQIREQLKDVVSSGGSLCVQSDETTKGKRKMQAFGTGIVGEDGSFRTLFLGLSQVAEKSSETAFSALQQKIGQLSQEPGFVDEMIAAFTCSMSDRAATQVKFNSLIRAYREQILPSVVSGWDSLSEEEKLRQKEFSEFFCQLHIISNLTDVVLEALAQSERPQLDKAVPKAQPAVLSVLKEAERLLGERSCGLHGIFPRWEAWCREKGVEHYALPSFHGHRWNIVFLLAARTVYLLPHILQFIEDCGADKPELLELSGWLSDPFVVSHLQILGLVDQKITGPVWRLCEQSQHILETCAYASRLREWIQATLSDPVDFFSSSVFVASSSTTDQATGHLLKALVSIPPSETSLQAVLLVLSDCDDYLSQVFVDFLPNGKYYGRDDLSERTSCAPASNRSIESFFGLVSHLHSYSPNMRLVRMESQALLKKNSTMEWLASLPAHLRAELLKEARQNIRKIGQAASEEKQAVLNQILRLARAKKIQQEEKNVSEMRARARLTEAILVWGFWRASVDMNMKLKDLPGTKQRAAMTAQIRFRQKVMMQPEPRPGLYKLTVNKAACSLPELKTRLLELFEYDKMSVQVLSRDEVGDFPGRTILHRFKDDSGNPSEYEGFIESVERRGTGQPMAIIHYSGYDTPHSVSLVELKMGIESGDVSFLDPL